MWFPFLICSFAIIIVCLSYVFYVKENYTEYTRLRCPTRNMSYDLRGEAAFPVRRNNYFMNSSIGPYDPMAC